MSLSGEIRTMVDVIEAKTALAKNNNPQQLIKSLINSFPDDLSLSDSVHGLSDSDNNLNLEDQQSGMLTPIKHHQSTAASTPSLSLPDSFDVDCAPITTKSGLGAMKISSNVAIGGYSQKYLELERKAAEEKQALLVQLSEARRLLDEAVLEKDTLQSELIRVNKVTSINIENQHMEISALTDRNLRLNAALESEVALRRTNEERANKFDLADAELNKLRRETAELRSTMEQQSAAVKALTTSEAQARKVADDVGRVRELLVLDKTHLQQELRAAEQRQEERAKEVGEQRSQCLALEVKVAQLTDQLLTLQLTARSGFDERMDKEIQRLRDENSKEMESLKATSRDIMDRENRVLREAKTSLENECNQLRLRNDNLNQQLSHLQQENSNLQHEKNNTISELRAEIKMKSFELTTLGVSFEERMGQLRQSELEVEVLRQEVSAHKSAILRLEGDNQHESQQLRSELDQAVTKLRAYEALEEEIDGAVMRTAGITSASADSGGSGGGGGASADAAVEAATNKLLGSVKGIPTNPERRVKQAVYLAQRLLEAEKKSDLLKSEVDDLRQKLKYSQQQGDIARENLTRAAQPTAYLVSKLRDEESAKAAFANKCKVLEDELVQSRKSVLSKAREVDQLRDRLGSVLQQRGELETVKVMLSQLQAMEEEDDDDEEEEEVEEDLREVYKSAANRRRAKENGDRNNRDHDPDASATTAASEQKDSNTPPRGGQQVEASPPGPAPAAESSHDTPSRDMVATAAALGLTPEQLEVMTSPPRSSPGLHHYVTSSPQ